MYSLGFVIFFVYTVIMIIYNGIVIIGFIMKWSIIPLVYS